MPPPTPLPVIAHLIGLFRQGFWRRLAGRFFGRRATEQAEDPVEEFLLPILEAISRIAEAVQNGTYREPEYAPWEPDERDPRPPDEAAKTSDRKPRQIREPDPEPPWLSGPLQARPRASRPPPAAPPAERPSAAPQAPSAPERPRPSWPPARSADRPPRPPPRVRIPPKKSPPEACEDARPCRSVIATINRSLGVASADAGTLVLLARSRSLRPAPARDCTMLTRRPHGRTHPRETVQGEPR
jgi:hypothetical protein